MTWRASSIRSYLDAVTPDQLQGLPAGTRCVRNRSHYGRGLIIDENKHSTDDESKNRARAFVQAVTQIASHAPLPVRVLPMNGPRVRLDTRPRYTAPPRHVPAPVAHHAGGREAENFASSGPQFSRRWEWAPILNPVRFQWCHHILRATVYSSTFRVDVSTASLLHSSTVQLALCVG